MKWGTLVARGITPRYMTRQTGAVPADPGLQSMVVVDAGLLGARHIAKIPFPRLPKGGLMLRKGEALVCVAAKWPGPMAASGEDTMLDQESVVVNYLQLYRMLCSL